ncbi:MAG: hypothetical protein M1831_007346 [Alyxoria varia]|nr:MAG: hypothetical protein M1831_007346 [Alyxoria varia]
MSVGSVEIVDIVTSRLQQLLAKARELKSATAIEPPLPTSQIEEDVKTLSTPPHTELASPDKHSDRREPQHIAIETAARNILYDRIASTSVEDPEFVEIWNLFDILQKAADYDQCDESLTLRFIEELLDSQAIGSCSTVFDYMESRRKRLMKHNEMGKGSKSATVRNSALRSCNDLLRRLSRAEDAVFCGRVFLFLFQFFPLGDKSAINLRGEYHVENVTIFEEPKQDEVKEEQRSSKSRPATPPADGDATSQTQAKEAAGKDGDQDMKDAPPDREDTGVEEEAQRESDAKKKEEEERKRMDGLYKTFWSLQQMFSNPPKLLSKDDLESFKLGMEMTVKKFKDTPKVPRIGVDANPRGAKRKRDDNAQDFAAAFNPKYLTSRDLFTLELSDLTFQRHVLVQALIMLDFLLYSTPETKKKFEQLKAQKALVYDFELGKEDETWALNMKKTIGNYLQDGPDGKLYYRMVENILSRDKNWVRWKVEACQPITRPAVSAEDYTKSRNGAKRACTNRRIKSQVPGAVDFNFVSETQNVNNLETMTDPTRFADPKLESLVDEAKTVDLDLEMADRDRDQEEWAQLISQRASKTWKALRLAFKKSIRKLDGTEEEKNIDSLLEQPPPPQSETAEKPSDNSGQAEAGGDQIKVQEDTANPQDNDDEAKLNGHEPKEEPIVVDEGQDNTITSSKKAAADQNIEPPPPNEESAQNQEVTVAE